MYILRFSLQNVFIPVIADYEIGYIEKSEISPGCYISNCLTRKINGKAYVIVINTNEEFIRLKVNPFELKPVTKTMFKLNVNFKTNSKRLNLIKQNI